MPLCSRCFGFYLSFLVGIGIVVALELFLGFLGGECAWWIIGQFIILQLPLVVDGLIQYLTIYVSNNYLRFFTGLLSGGGCALLLVYLLVSIFW